MNDELTSIIRKQFYKIWPELLKYEDKIYSFVTTLDSNNPISPLEISKIIIESKNKGFTKFVFHCGSEALLLENIIKLQKVVDIIVPQVSSKDIFYVSGGLYSQSVYDKLAMKIRWKHRITILASHYCEATHTPPDVFKDVVYTPAIKNKKFLCYNRLHREHRIKLLEMMMENKHLEKGYYSFEAVASNTFDPEWISEIGDEFVNIKNNKHIFPLKLNLNEDRLLKSAPQDILIEDLEYFNDSYFSIVTEAGCYKKPWGPHHYFSDDSIISEKTFKPIICKHPFIMVGFVNLLSELRKIGYKTFHPYIDETYDTIEDDNVRLTMVVKEIERLCSKTDKEWIQWQHDIQDIVEYNHRTFFARTNYSITLDVEKYFKD